MFFSSSFSFSPASLNRPYALFLGSLDYLW